MQLEELYKRLAELRREGHGELQVYFRVNTYEAFPVLNANAGKLLSSNTIGELNPTIVALDWRSNVQQKRRNEAPADGRISNGDGPRITPVDPKQK